MAAPQNPDLAWAIQEVKDRAPALQRRRDYYDGKHAPVIPPAQTLSPLLQALLEDLSDNMCDDVVDETVDRLRITSWLAAPKDDLMGDGDGLEPLNGEDLGALAQQMWEDNRGPVREQQTYRDQGWAGDAYNIVQKNEATGAVRWFPQDPRQMAVAYLEDDPDVIRVAARVWRQRKPGGGGYRWRVNLYYTPGQEPRPGILLERYASRGDGADGGCPEPRAFEPLILEVTDPATGETVPDEGYRDWTRCPVFHFPAGEVGGYGRSFLTPVIPLQDALNKAIADLIVNMEDTALPQRYGTGIQNPRDPVTGEETPLRRRARRPSDMITVPSKDAQFGQFEAASMEPFMATIQGWRVEIARKGRLPAYSVNPDGEVPSGLSLLVQEGRQTKRCKTIQTTDGWVWREQMAYMLSLHLGREVKAADLDLEWAPPETRDEQGLWELLTLKAGLGVPRERLLVEGGYDQDEVAEWLEAQAAEQGGRVSVPGPGIASVTIPGVPGGMAVPAGAQAPGLGVPGAPNGPAGATQPGLAG